jgi:hypothetical protein
VLLVSFEFPYLCLSLFLQGLFWEGTDAPLLPTGSSRAWEMESVVVLASVREDAEGLVRKVALLEGELAELARPGRWPKTKFATCQAHQLRVRDS